MIQLDYSAISTANAITQRVSSSWPWYVIRAAGFTAAGLLILLMLSGIGQVTGLTYKYIEPIKAWAIHKAMAYALLVAILIHVGFLLVDNYIRFSIPQIIVPFLSHYNNKSQLPLLPFSSLAIAFGIIATYGILITVASSLKWIDTKKTTWRKLHYINYAVIMLVFLHALYAGSDLKYGLFRAIWILIALIVLLAVIYRLTRTNTLKR